MLVSLLIRYWYIPAILGLVIALGTTYKIMSLRVDGLKNQVVALQLQIDESVIKEKLLESNAKEITAKYADSLRLANDKIASQEKSLKERIKNDKESKGIKLSPSIISLFNDGKTSVKLKDPAISQPSDDGETRTDIKDLGDEKTLNDLLDVTATNDGNHAKCINQVVEWQDFWQDYITKYKAVINDPD